MFTVCFDCTLFVSISTYGHGNILPRLLSNLLGRIKKISRQNSEMRTKAAEAKYQPCSMQKQPVYKENTNLLFTSCKESSLK